MDTNSHAECNYFGKIRFVLVLVAVGLVFWAGTLYEEENSWFRGREKFGAFYAGNDLRGWTYWDVRRSDEFMDEVLTEFNKLNSAKPLSSKRLTRHELGYQIQHGFVAGDARPFLLFLYPESDKKTLIATASIRELDLDPLLSSSEARRVANELYKFILQKSA